MEFQEIRLLEEKIEALLGVLQDLRREKEELLAQLRQKEEEISGLRTELSRLREERDLIKEKVQGLLSRIDQLLTG
ncbi:MAG: cell division protein ZapB [Thermodesulfobacteria bacterium]|nr:cell division protein ZapB [Thermodesulfobacteriota bacterium]